MGLVTAKEVAKAIKADKYGFLGTFSGWLLMKVLKISTLNKFYDKNKHLEDVAFLNAILDDLENIEIQKEISLHNWPEMQYISLKLSGEWSNMDLKFSSFNGYPDIKYLNGIHFAGLKPWNIKNKSLKSFGRFDDYKLWYYTYLKMCDKNERLLVNTSLKKIYLFAKELTTNQKYQFNKFDIKHLNHFFK